MPRPSTRRGGARLPAPPAPPRPSRWQRPRAPARRAAEPMAVASVASAGSTGGNDWGVQLGAYRAKGDAERQLLTTALKDVPRADGRPAPGRGGARCRA